MAADPDASAAEPFREELRGGRGGSVEMQRVDWLWTSRLARGEITILTGEYDVGKTTILADRLARITRGASLDGELGAACQPEPVLVFLGEDDIRTSFLPRFVAAGGNPDLLHWRSGIVDTPAGPRPFGLPGDARLLDQDLDETGACVLALEPLTAFWDEDVRTISGASVRRALLPLHEVVQRRRVAAIATVHVNKSSRSIAKHRVAGALDLAAQARVVLVVGDRPDGDGGVVAVLKSNLAHRDDRQTLGFHFETVEVEPDILAPRIVWDGEIPLSADDLLSPTREDSRPVEDARLFLQGFLDQRGGWAMSREVMAAAEADGINERTLKRAKKDLRIASRQTRVQGRHLFRAKRTATFPHLRVLDSWIPQ